MGRVVPSHTTFYFPPLAFHFPPLTFLFSPSPPPLCIRIFVHPDGGAALAVPWAAVGGDQLGGSLARRGLRGVSQRWPGAGLHGPYILVR